MNYTLDFFKTGNKYIDSLLICIIFSCMPIVVRYIKRKNFKKYLNKLYYTFFYKECYIELTSVKQYSHRIKVRSSDRYNAVLFYIVNVLKCENIRFLKENQASYQNRFGQMFKNYDDEEEQFTKFPFEIKTLNGKIPIENNIYFEFEEDESETSDHDRKVKIITTIMRLSSDSGIFHIKDFIDKCVKIFDEFLHNLTKRRKKEIFTYINNSNGKLECRNELFPENVECLKDAIFDNKMDILHALKIFTNNPYYKRHPQVIQKLVALLYGLPGTGKTSVCRMIAKYLDRHILEVKLSDIKTVDDLYSIFHFKAINNLPITPKEVIIVIDDALSTNLLISRNKTIKKEFKNTEMLQMVAMLNSSKDDKNKKIMNNNSTITSKDFQRALDGTASLEKHVVLITTNSSLYDMDQAFLRSERITLSLNFEKCSKQISIQLIERYFKKEEQARKEQEKIELKENGWKCSKEQIMNIPHKQNTCADIITVLKQSNSLQDIFKFPRFIICSKEKLTNIIETNFSKKCSEIQLLSIPHNKLSLKTINTIIDDIKEKQKKGQIEGTIDDIFTYPEFNSKFLKNI